MHLDDTECVCVTVSSIGQHQHDLHTLQCLAPRPAPTFSLAGAFLITHATSINLTRTLTEAIIRLGLTAATGA